MSVATSTGRGEPWKPDGPAGLPARRPGVAGPLRHRAAWRLASAAVFLSLCGGMVWLVTWLSRPQPVRAVYLAAGYETNLAVPHNSYGRRWADDVAALTGGTAAELRRDARWDAALRGVKAKTVLVAVTAQGGTDANGPYLLPTDAAPGLGAENRLRLAAILARLAGLPEGTKKVLLLEAGQSPANPLFGPPGSDFAQGLEDTDFAAVPNLSVLTANGPGERAWPAEAHRSTAFGHYLRAGLAGAADADGDRRVTLWELYEYLAPRVAEWSARTRAAVQTPRLYPPGPEGERRARAVVVAHLEKTPPAAEEAIPPLALPPALPAAWDRYAARSRQDPPPASYAPHLWQVYGATLVRAEELALARDEGGAGTVLMQAGELEAKLDAARRVEVSDPLLAAAVFGAAADPAARAAVDGLWAAPPADAAKAAGQLAPSPGVYDRLLDRAAEDPARNLVRAVELVRLLDRPGRPRPPAAHLLVMLATKLPPVEQPGRAELIRTALTVRRQGEVAAAAGGVGYADRLRPWLADRLKAADEARTRGEDRLFTTEPGSAADELAAAKAGYAAVLAEAAKLRAAFQTRDRLFAELPFLAGWAVRRSTADAKTAEPADELIKLWAAVHALDRTLAPPTDVADVVRSAGGLAARLDALTATVAAQAGGLLPAPPPGLAPRVGRDTIERALAVPTLAPDVRARLWPLADRFNREAAAATDPVAAVAPDGTADRQAAELAAAALGRAEPQPAFTRVPQLADEVRRLLETDPVGDPAAIRTAFWAAERLARLTPVALPPYRTEPAVALRGLLAQDLALGLAERHVDGLWAGDTAADEPYYKQAAGPLLTDVATLGPVDPVRDRLGKLRGRLDVPFRPTITGTAPVATTETTPFAVEVALGGGRRDVWPGFLTLWAEPPAGLALVGPAARQAFPWPDTGKYRVEVAGTAATNQATAVTVRGFFRGWEVTGRAPVDLYPLPDVIDTAVAPPPAAAVTVRASADAVRKYGCGEGAVAIVIDCSGSMGTPEGRPVEESRYLQGVVAAGKIITGLPRNTVVTVWVFGQAGEANKKVEAAEQTITKIAGPISRDPDVTDQVSTIIGRLAKLEPFNESPIFRALLTARDDVLSAPGYRAVVLVSDGLDNRTVGELAAAPKGEALAALLRTKLRDERVVIHAVGFTPRSKDDAAAGGQLRDFVEGLPTPGKYAVAPDVEELSAALRAGLNSRLTARLTPRTAVGKAIELDVTPGGTAARWVKAPAGGYKLTTDSAAEATAVRLSAGDRLLLGLTVAPAGPSFRRLLLAEEFPTRPFGRSDRGDWRVTVLQNQRRGDGLAMLVGLEEAGTAAIVTRPAEVWFDLGTDFPELAPAAVRWRPVYDYSAPVWEVLAPAWPNYPGGSSPARPTLRAWFEPSRSAAAAGTIPLGKILDAATPVAVPVGGEDVSVERIDPAVVGGPAPPPGTIALRVRHAVDRPVLVKLDGVDVLSSERRVYSHAGRTVGLFRLADASDPRAARVTLVPLAGFKAAARRIDVRDIPPPDPDDARTPPTAMKE